MPDHSRPYWDIPDQSNSDTPDHPYWDIPDQPPLSIRQRNIGAHGDAGFALPREVEAAKLVTVTLDDIRNGIYLGHFLNPYTQPAPQFGNKWEAVGQLNGSALAYGSENNIVTIAPAGSSKGTAAIIPTLLTCDESMFVLDVKGENWFVTLPARQAMDHHVVLIDPFDIWGDDDQLGNAMPPSDQFNPLQFLRQEQKRFASDIDSLAAAIITHEGSGDPHWTDRARQLVACLMAHVCSDRHELEEKHNNLPYIREVIGKAEADFAAYMEVAALTSAVPLVRDTAATFAVTGSREIASIRSTAMGQLGFLNHSGIRDFLSASSFSFADLRKKPMTIFCMFPPHDLDTYYRFARLMTQCFFNSLSKTPKADDRRVLALLDEQAKLRHMDIIETSVALLRGYKVRIWSIFQDITQIKSIYGEAWETFISNAGVIQVMTPNGATTAEYFSKRTGNETITEIKNTFSSPDAPMFKPTQQGSTSTYEVTSGVPFLSSQNFYAMPRDKAVLYVQGLPYPVMTTRQAYYSQQRAGRFYDMPFAPHPVHEPTAFDWMKSYLKTHAGNP
jgi:type IV secretion system protein VirD4